MCLVRRAMSLRFVVGKEMHSPRHPDIPTPRLCVFRLARRAPVGAAPREAYLADRVRAAGEAGLALAVVDAQMLKVAAGVAEGVAEPLGVERRAAVRDAPRQYVSDRCREARDL